jgi:hypothetical protein
MTAFAELDAQNRIMLDAVRIGLLLTRPASARVQLRPSILCIPRPAARSTRNAWRNAVMVASAFRSTTVDVLVSWWCRALGLIWLYVVTFVFRCGYQKLGRLLRTYTRLASCYRNRGSPPCFMTLWAFAATAVPSTIAVANANRIVFRIETSGIGPLSASHTSRLGRTMRPNSDPKSNCVL